MHLRASSKTLPDIVKLVPAQVQQLQHVIHLRLPMRCYGSEEVGAR